MAIKVAMGPCTGSASGPLCVEDALHVRRGAHVLVLDKFVVEEVHRHTIRIGLDHLCICQNLRDSRKMAYLRSDLLNGSLCVPPPGARHRTGLVNDEHVVADDVPTGT